MKNKKGFFLAEAIVVTSIVALTITLIFPQFANRYERMKFRLLNYNRAPDVYAAKYIYDNRVALSSNMTCTLGTNYYKIVLSGNYNVTQIIETDFSTFSNLKTNYSSADVNFKKFLKSIEAPISDKVIIFEFEYNGIRRYAMLNKTPGIAASLTCN